MQGVRSGRSICSRSPPHSRARRLSLPASRYRSEVGEHIGSPHTSIWCRELRGFSGDRCRAEKRGEKGGRRLGPLSSKFGGICFITRSAFAIFPALGGGTIPERAAERFVWDRGILEAPSYR